MLKIGKNLVEFRDYIIEKTFSNARYKIIKIISFFLVFHLTFFINFYFLTDTAHAATLVAGSNIVLCTAGVSQPAYTTESYPRPTFNWVFSSSQSDYNDGVAPPNDPTPNLAAATQASYWVEIDDSADYASPVVQTGEVASAATSYAYSGSALSFRTVYYWRIKVKDSYGSITDWATGVTFLTNKPTIKLKGSIKLKGNIKLD